MSRILRRPMFRGGRVDSRGTGITSNLGYAGGGSVNTPRRGFVTGPGGYAGIPKYKTGAEIIEEVYAKPWLTTTHLSSNLPVRTTGTGEASGVNTTDKFIPNPERIIRGQATGGGMKRNPNYKPPTRTVERNVRGSKSTVQQPLTKEEIAFTTEGDHPGQVMLKPEVESEIYKPAPDTKPEKTKAEKLAEYKEMFEEAYGTGKSEDISNMLLSFAGKALKPEATTKTAFGEFFEEEGKRPSASKKYKDAAATAAINAFLAGETSYQKFQDDLSVFGKKLEMQKDFTKASETIDSLLSEFSKPAGKDKTDQGVMQSAFERAYADVPGFKGFEGKMPEDIEKNELIVGAIYFDDIEGSSAKQVFIIDATGTPVKLKKVFK